MMSRTWLIIFTTCLLQSCAVNNPSYEFYRGEIKYQYDSGNTYYKAGKYDKAIASFQKVTKMFPENERGYASLGHAYLAKGDSQNALANYQKAVDRNPDIKESLLPYISYALTSNDTKAGYSLEDLENALNEAKSDNGKKLKSFVTKLNRRQNWIKQNQQLFSERMIQVTDNIIKINLDDLADCQECLYFLALWVVNNYQHNHDSFVNALLQHMRHRADRSDIAYQYGLVLERTGQRVRAIHIYLQNIDNPKVMARIARLRR